MESQSCERAKSFSEKQNLYLQHVAILLEMDMVQLSKVEKGLRQLKRGQIPILSNILNVEKDELLTLWVADQIIDVTSGEDVALKAIQVAQKEILSQYNKNK